MGDFILNNRIRSQSGNLMLQLTHARSEAMRTASRVTICPGTSGGCTGTGSTSEGKWESGWVAFIDTNSNTALDTGETVISVSAALDGDNTLRSDAFSTYISFRHDGSSADISGASQGGSFALCDRRSRPFGDGDDAWAIVITVTGRIKVLKANATGSGISDCGIED